MHSVKTKIGILGAGSIGCFLGGILASQNVEAIFIGRENLKNTLNKYGLTLTHYQRDGVNLSANKLAIQASPKYLEGCEVIFVCTKSQDTAQAARQIKTFASPTAHIVSCQNGINNVPSLKEILGETFTQISGAIIPFNVTPTSPGHYHCGTGGALHVEHALPADITAAFQAAGQAIKYGGNFTGDQWAKLLVNLNNALNTLAGGTLQEGLLQRPYRQALSQIVHEGLVVAKANNITLGTFNGRSPTALIKTLALPNCLYRLVMQAIVKIDAKARSSMLDDLETGRPSEINFLQGEIVNQAEKAGMQAPKNSAVLLAVKAAFENGKSPHLSGQDILDLIKI